VFNELTIKFDYNKITDTYDYVYSINHVDEDSFPEYTEIYPVWSEAIELQDGTGDALYMDHPSYTVRDYVVAFGVTESGVIDIMNNNTDNIYKLDVYDPFNNELPFIYTNVEYIETVSDISYFYVDRIDGKTFSSGGAIATERFYYNQNDTAVKWKTYCNMEDYVDAKNVWEVCHETYLETRTVNLAPTSLTNLDWYIDKNNYYGDTSYDRTVESARKYLDNAIYWLTRQKYTINLQIPVNNDTVKLSLMQRCIFKDDILTVEGYDNIGWITNIQLSPNSNVFDVELTFEYFGTRIPPMMDGDIWESGDADTEILESGFNDIDIIEG